MDKAKVLETIQTERAQLDGLLAQLSAEQMCQTALENQWSIKDVLAHIATWERRCAGWIQAGLHGERPDKPEKRSINSIRRRTWRTGTAPLMTCSQTRDLLTRTCWSRYRRSPKTISRIPSASHGQMAMGLSPISQPIPTSITRSILSRSGNG